MFLGKESDEQRGDVGGLEYVFGELTQQLRFRSQLVDRILQYDLFSKWNIIYIYTPLQFNIAPENGWLEDVRRRSFPFGIR